MTNPHRPPRLPIRLKGPHVGDVEKEIGLWHAVKKTSKYATSACT